jgi:thiol-disulfide isomerase/thioredoxin
VCFGIQANYIRRIQSNSLANYLAGIAILNCNRHWKAAQYSLSASAVEKDRPRIESEDVMMLSRYSVALITICFCGRIFAVDQNSPETQAPTESRAMRSALTDEQIVRGQAIRDLLVLGIDFAREHGDWPKQLSELKAVISPPLTYLGQPALPKDFDQHLPKELAQQVQGQLKSLAAVCHESLAVHPDGAWVGYADGHIELVRDVDALRVTLTEFETACPLVQKMWEELAAAETAKSPNNDTGLKLLDTAKLVLKLVDESGQPVAGARVGYVYYNADYDAPGGRSRLMTRIGDKAPQTISDDSGQVEIQYQWFFDPEDSSARANSLIAYHQDRGLIAVESLRTEDFAKTVNGNAATREVKLHRGVRVTGTVGCVGVSPEANEALWTAALVYTLSDNLRPMTFMSKRHMFEFLLPPGDYYLRSYGEGVYPVYRFLRLTESLQSSQLHLDLPPDQTTSLTGKIAPALRQIKSWKNGDPTTLEKLRGKWVVLDFWGYWCGPCVGSMPELMKLHDEFADKGLVIIAVHDDSVASIEELNKNLENTKQELWKGRDLPFLVALDGGGELPIAGTENRVKGATHAAYGVQHWPTTIVIDPQGKIVGERDPRRPELRELLEKELKPTKP